MAEDGIHRGGMVLQRGDLTQARAVMLLIHGRGANAQSILSLADELQAPEFAYLAPQAAGDTWYPYRFLEPLERNEPYLSSALGAVGDVIAQLGEYGIPPERIILLGFSQGACLALEYAARNARRYGGVVGLSGGLIGPDDAPHHYPGSLEGTPIFLGCSTTDSHIPMQRVLESARILRGLGGAVTERLYPNMGHTINDDEIAFVREMMRALIQNIAS